MNLSWKTFLDSRSAAIGEAGSVHFDHAELFPDCALFDLSRLGLIRIGGEDAEGFLQGQVTNDLTQLDDRRSQMNAYCTPKGRMQANFRTFRRGGDFFLQMPIYIHTRFIKRLSMFVLMSKVDIEDLSDQRVCIGLAGECAETLLQGRFETLPTDPGGVEHQGETTLIRLPGDRPRFEIIGAVVAIKALWEALEKMAPPANANFWSLLDIRAGIPTIHTSTAEAFVPQMTNMQLINGLSFTKGCYVGQEVVARTKYLGKLKRRMYRVRVNSEQPPVPGEKLFSSDSHSSQGTGTIVNTAPSPEGGYELLAVVEITAVEQNNLHLGSDSGPRLELMGLPYPFEDE